MPSAPCKPLRVAPLVLCWATWACDEGERPLFPELPLREPAWVAAGPLLERFETLSDTVGLHRASDLRSVPAGLFVVDTGNDRLVLFDDATLEPMATMGRSGSGPGELRIPMQVERSGDLLAVSELGNLRVSFFTPDGVFVRAVRLGVPYGDVAVDPGGVLYVASGPDASYLTRIGADLGPEPFATVPEELRAEPGDGASRSPLRNTLVAHAGGSVHVLDNDRGILLSYGSSGTLEGARSLPARVLEPLVRRQAQMHEGLTRSGFRPFPVPLVKQLVPVEDGGLLILLPLQDPFGILVDADLSGARLLHVPPGTEGWTPLGSATAASIRGREVTVLHEGGISRYRLEEAAG